MPQPANNPQGLHPKLCVLIAYPYFTRQVHAFLAAQNKADYQLMVDSGAFTAKNKGTVIDVRDYGAFLQSLADLRPLHAVQLDVIGNPDATRNNLDAMQAAGHDVMPVFTRGDSLQRLDQLYKTHDYVLLGGVAAGESRHNYLAWFMRRNHGRKVHWLGFSQMQYAKHFKPYSMDSSGWTSGLRYGQGHLYAGQGKMLPFNRATIAGGLSFNILQAGRNVGLHAGHLAALQVAGSWAGGCVFPSDDPLSLPSRGIAAFFTALSYVKLACECRVRVGTMYYLAVNSELYMNTVFRAYAFLRASGCLPRLRKADAA